MRINGWLEKLAVRSLSESMDSRNMVKLARKLLHNYDIYDKTNYPRNIQIPKIDIASQIVKDVIDEKLFLSFVDLLIEISQTGLMGRQYKIPFLREILEEIYKAGFLYHEEMKMFVEDPRVMKTTNWGVLREQQEYQFTFLHVDIVDNSILVRKYPSDVIQSTYMALRNKVQEAVDKRNGRIWNWEGDGGLIAFYLPQKNNSAALSAMEIIHEMFIYNMLHCNLDEPLEIRISVHSGQCEFCHNLENITSDAIEKLLEIESKYTQPNSVTFSSAVYLMLDHNLAEQLEPLKGGEHQTLYKYELKWEADI